MPGKFRDAINNSLANPGLQRALDGNAERRLSARQTAYRSLPEDLPVLRQRLRQARARVIAGLEGYLEQFTTHASQNGLIVHHAADGAEANRIILEIARQNNARLVAKSKTMVGEEIGINKALQDAGIEVVETDLGEYIVQLRGERPAHIITPAVHLQRSDVAKTFQDKLGMEYTEDIPTMTAAARRVLRQTFLNADIGLSGVNFGVAETGTLCLLTNEGNGRMVTTLPRIHIALMGIERLVATMDDLSLMLALLPRSATGQKITVYTSLIQKPRQAGEMDGPEQRHLILLDNGRRSFLGSPMEEALYCIRCGACLNACPVFREIGGHAYVGKRGEETPYPGPIGSVISPGLFGVSEFAGLARASSLCGACKEACPVDIDLPRLLLQIRAGNVKTNEKHAEKLDSPSPVNHLQPGTAQQVPVGLNLALRLYAWAASSPTRYSAAQWFAGIIGRLLAPSGAWIRMPRYTGWGLSRDLPRPNNQTFRARYTQGKIRQFDEDYDQSQALVIAAPTESEKKPDPIEYEFNPEPELPVSALARFSLELTGLGGVVTECKLDEVADLISASLSQRGINALQAWKGGSLPDTLLEKLSASGVKIVHEPDPDLKVGLTAAIAGVAETGTLVLTGSPAQPLTTSLLPELHIAILEAEKITWRLSDIFQEVHPAYKQIIQSPMSVLVSGPSRTADIELTLTIGVHGPGELHVYCLV